MKVLLTGAGGFLGRRVAASLAAAGIDDIRLHFRGAAPGAMLDGLAAAHPGTRFGTGSANLLYPRDLPALVSGVDCIVHAAAGMRGSAADMFANTVVGTRNLLDAAVRGGVRRVVLVGSFAVYRTEGLARNAVHDESVPVEEVGIEKGAYAHAKTRQEHLLAEYRAKHGIQTVVLRPGVIYGPGGGGLSSRVGIGAMGMFFSLGRGAELPLTYVDNCADAVAHAVRNGVDGCAYNVVDDALPSCRQYLARYQARVGGLRVFPVPYWMLATGSRWLQRYHRTSKGQLPALLTPYVVRSMYRPFRHSNAALKAIGWRPRVATEDGLRLTFEAMAGRPP